MMRLRVWNKDGSIQQDRHIEQIVVDERGISIYYDFMGQPSGYTLEVQPGEYCEIKSAHMTHHEQRQESIIESMVFEYGKLGVPADVARRTIRQSINKRK